MLIFSLASQEQPFWGFFSFLEQIETLQAVVLLAGLILLLVELFAPGFGVAGGLGIAMVILGIILTASSLFEAMAMFSLLVVAVAIVLTFVLRSAKKGRLSRTLVLQSSSLREEGYRTSDDPSSLIGKTGKALTQLRPSGTADFDNHRLDVVSNGSFIDQGATIRIINAYGSRIIVEVVEQPPSEEQT